MKRQMMIAAIVLLPATELLAQDKDGPVSPSVKVDPANPSGNQLQPQGWTGPINTQSGGVPAESPQGQTPPGMQSAPLGSDKTIRTDAGGVPEGTPKTETQPPNQTR